MPASSSRIFILSALSADRRHGSATLQALLGAAASKGLRPEVVDLPSSKVQACYGCGACGLTTPGTCTVQDEMQRIFPKIVSSQIWVLASPIRFGSHHSELKKALDRCQPLMVPVYTVRGGEMNFRPRYAPRPALLGVGLLPEPDADQEQAYRHLVARHGLNLAAERHACAVVTGADVADVAQAKIELALADLLEPAPRKRTKR